MFFLLLSSAGANPDTVYIHSEEISDVTYMVDRVHVKVKAIGSLTTQDPAVGVSRGPDKPSHSGTKNENVTTSTGTEVEALEDNPLWPNSSAEDRDKDIAANLPPPQVQGAEWTLSVHDIECLATGAAILGCGGGGSPNNGTLRASKMLKEGKKIKILNPCRYERYHHYYVSLLPSVLTKERVHVNV